MSLEGAKRRQAGPVVRLDLRMRSQHVEYLAYIAERDDVSVTRALTVILEENLIGFQRPPSTQRSQKARVHLCVSEHHLALLDRLAVITGRTRTEAAMRVIEAAYENDRPKKLAVGA